MPTVGSPRSKPRAGLKRLFQAGTWGSLIISLIKFFGSVAGGIDAIWDLKNRSTRTVVV